MVYKYLANPEPPAITVSAMVPSPTTVYRFWDATAKVDRVEAPAFSFSGDGKVAEIAAPGTRYGAGDVLAAAGRRARSSGPIWPTTASVSATTSRCAIR